MPANARSLQVTDTYRNRVVAVRARAERTVAQRWQQVDLARFEATFTDWHGAATTAVTRAQVEAVRLSGAYLAAFLSSELGRRVTTPSVDTVRYAGLSRDDRPLAESFDSPRIGTLVALKDGATNEDALRAGLNRAVRMAEMDVMHAARTSLLDQIDQDDRFEGWQRAVRGTCGACAGKATGRTSGLNFQVHPGCQCVSEPAVVPSQRLENRVFPNGLATGEYLTREVAGRGEDALTRLVQQSKVTREFDGVIADRLAATHRANKLRRPDVVVSPPADPGKADRFGGIRRRVARALGDADHASPFRERFDIPGYREMTIPERIAATRERGTRFALTDPKRIKGKVVLIVDDVVVSGEQARALRTALLEAGARDVQFVSLARAKGLSVRGGRVAISR